MAQIKALKNISGRMIGRLTRIECGTVIDVPDEAAAQLVVIEYAEAVKPEGAPAPGDATEPAPPADASPDTEKSPEADSGDDSAPKPTGED